MKNFFNSFDMKVAAVLTAYKAHERMKHLEERAERLEQDLIDEQERELTGLQYGDNYDEVGEYVEYDEDDEDEYDLTQHREGAKDHVLWAITPFLGGVALMIVTFIAWLVLTKLGLFSMYEEWVNELLSPAAWHMLNSIKDLIVVIFGG